MAARRTRPPLRPGTTEWGRKRVALGLSQRQVEKLAGVNRATISLIESGRLTPTATEAEKLLAIYNSTPSV